MFASNFLCHERITVALLKNSYHFNWIDPFLHSQSKAVAYYGHSYALSENAKCEKHLGHGVIFGVLQ